MFLFEIIHRRDGHGLRARQCEGILHPQGARLGGQGDIPTIRPRQLRDAGRERAREELKNGMLWSRSQGPLRELDRVGVAHAPVAVSFGIVIGFNAE